MFIIHKTFSLQCSTDSDLQECNHFYDTTLNETSCAIWWKMDSETYTTKIFQLPPFGQSCFSKDDFVKAFPDNSDYEFDEKCLFQKYLPLAGFCFCKTGDFCNEKLLNDTTKLNTLISKMEKNN
uniref:Uncharacterized protein n=1 Tax=Panagrolaimus davidi TaxID=227884 RepID=A0A914R027_9BILA